MASKDSKSVTSGIRGIRASSFFNTAFKEFSLYDNVRSIPTLFDGLKPSQRKIIYGFQLRGENAGEIQVERAAASIAACVTGDTLVTLADDTEIAIEDLEKRFSTGETFYVRSFNVRSGGFEDQLLLNCFMSKESTELINISLINGKTLSLTPEHRVLTGRGWIKAENLNHDDELISFD